MTFKLIKYLRFKRGYYLGRYKIRKKIKKAAAAGNIKVILGSNDSFCEGWISTDLPHFDITKSSDWDYFFKSYEVNNFLAEHVLEHLTKPDGEIAARLVFKYLKRGGCFRIAVPDAWHPNPEYINRESDTSNYYQPPHNHKSFWNMKTLSELLISIGFTVELLEYCSEKKEIITTVFANDKGIIKRSFSKGYVDEIKDYSSLIIDSKKY
jgi:predicted SAM-dependent methyltransferase